MKTVVHVCPILVARATAIVERLDDGGEVRGMRGEPEAARCRPDLTTSVPATHIVLAGDCTEPVDAAHVETNRSGTCFGFVMDPVEVAGRIHDGGHLLVPSMMATDEPAWVRWGFADTRSAREYAHGTMRSLVLVGDDDPTSMHRATRLADDLAVPLAVERLDGSRLELHLRAALAEARGRAETRQGAVRRGDAIARVGGDEFVVIATDLDGPQGARRVAEKVLQALTLPFVFGPIRIETAASIGGALCPQDTDRADTLLTFADTAMYAAKDAGRGRIRAHDPQQAARWAEASRTREAVRDALDADGVSVALHPVVALDDGAVVGVEALARITVPGLGAMSPTLFIPIAEASGLMPRLGERIAELALDAAAAWPANRRGDLPWVSINVSGSQLHGAFSADWLRAATQQRGIEPSRVVVEVTERVMLDEMPGPRQELDHIADTGAVLALDDFCTGYSALSCLRDVDAAIIKLDRSFIITATEDDEAGAMLDGVTGLLRRLGRTVILEGIERRDQLRRAYDAGCRLGQGFYWTRPLPPSGFLEWYADHRTRPWPPVRTPPDAS